MTAERHAVKRPLKLRYFRVIDGTAASGCKRCNMPAVSGTAFALGLAALLLLPLIVAIFRSNQLFVLRVRAGKLKFIRGRMPQPLFEQISDIVRGTNATGHLIVVTENGRPRLVPKGQFDAGLLQQTRNVVGLYPLAKIRAGGRPRG
jgi:hypothetical protein